MPSVPTSARRCQGVQTEKLGDRLPDAEAERLHQRVSVRVGWELNVQVRRLSPDNAHNRLARRKEERIGQA